MHRGTGSQMQTGPIVMRQRGQDSDAGGINTQTQKGPWTQRDRMRGARQKARTCRIRTHICKGLLLRF